jgi:hypothetical protein
MQYSDQSGEVSRKAKVQDMGLLFQYILQQSDNLNRESWTPRLCSSFLITLYLSTRALKPNSRLLYDGLQSYGNKDKAAWSWKEKGSLLDLPGMSPEIALSFQLTQQFLDELIPCKKHL